MVFTHTGFILGTRSIDEVKKSQEVSVVVANWTKLLHLTIVVQAAGEKMTYKVAALLAKHRLLICILIILEI